MMGKQHRRQAKLSYYRLPFKDWISQDGLLRPIQTMVDQQERNVGKAENFMEH